MHLLSRSNVKENEMVKNCKNKSNQKKFEGDLKIKLCSKRLYPTESVSYLAVKIDTKLSWQFMAMIFPLNWVDPPMLFFRKWENMLALKY